MKKLFFIIVLSVSLSPGAFAKVGAKVTPVGAKAAPQGGGCRYVCREEYKICRRRGRRACLRQYRRCVQSCPR